MRRLTIGDRRVRLRDEGESKGTPAILIHGAAGSSVMWMDVVRRHSGRRRLVAPDLPGHGQSDPWHDPSLAVYQDFVGTVCASLGIGRALLWGHSMGGAIALGCALAWPERVAGLVLVATGARLRVSPSIFGMIENDFANFAGHLQKWSFSPATALDLADRWTAVSVQAAPEICIADFRAVDGFDVRPRLGEIKVPTLILGGADDLLTPPKLQHELAAGIAGSRLVIVPHAGHSVLHEQPQIVAEELDRFLGEVA